MFDIIDTHVIAVNVGYCALHAKRYAETHGLALVVVTPPETWEETEADEQAW